MSKLPRELSGPTPARTSATAHSRHAYATWRRTLAGQSLPLAWLDLDALTANAQAILNLAGTKPVRLVSKSVRSVEALRWLLAFSPQFQGILCYHPREAVYLSQQGFDDLLVAYPSLQEAALRAVCEETARGKRLVLMVDSIAHVEPIARMAAELNIQQPICLDLDLSLRLPKLWFGVHRSPLRSVRDLRELCSALDRLPQVKVVGLMGYEAQIAGVGDRVPGKPLQNRLMPLLKHWSRRQVLARRRKAVKTLQQAGVKLAFVNGGGTGSLAFTVSDPSVTEIAVGSGFFSPHLFDYYDDFRYQPAAGFALEIARQPRAGIYTCNGGGYVASGCASAERLPQPYQPAGLRLDAQEGAGEVQTPLRVGDSGSDAAVLKPGDPVLFRHAKAGELCERFNELWVVQAGEIVDQWRTYRGDGQVFV